MATTTEAQLKVGFYNDTCPQAESIVYEAVYEAWKSDPGIAAGLLRLHFRDCFVRGCEASILIDSTTGHPAEKDFFANLSLRGFKVIDAIKAKLEAACKGTVSCADILAFAARDSVNLTGGPGFYYDVPSGRRDGVVSNFLEARSNLPLATDGLAVNAAKFAQKGLTQQEMIALLGAHTIGNSHCLPFQSRLYSFNGVAGAQDPSLDPAYAPTLKASCPKIVKNASATVVLDPVTPNQFDNQHYKNVLLHDVLLTSDQTLLSTLPAARTVALYALNPSLWQSAYIEAVVKMGKTGVLTGKAGQIRSNCHKINSWSGTATA